jgi:hypothetical protein
MTELAVALGFTALVLLICRELVLWHRMLTAGNRLRQQPPGPRWGTTSHGWTKDR